MKEVGHSARLQAPANEGANSMPSAGELEISVIRRAGDWTWVEPVDALVEACGKGVAATLGLKPAASEIVLALSNDDEMQRLNAQFRNQDKATNVLAFPAPVTMPAAGGSGLGETGCGGAQFMGDVVLGAETVAREAQALGIPEAHHFQHLVVHGILHILGYDHEEVAAAEIMEGLETKILAGLNIPDPYAEPENHK